LIGLLVNPVEAHLLLLGGVWRRKNVNVVLVLQWLRNSQLRRGEEEEAKPKDGARHGLKGQGHDGHGR